jgi:formylglycine-generating enzyme required for sulfatase activity
MKRALLGAGAVGLVAVTVVWLVVYQPFPPSGYGAEREAEVFRDCESCPEMLPIAPGVFSMGQDPRRREVVMAWLGGPKPPRRVVTVAEPFALGRHEITFDQWEACVAGGGCEGYLPEDEGWGRGAHPVIHVSWNDAQAYVRWLSDETGEAYRLPSEAEWEYAARAGTQTPYSWGKRASHHWANYGAPECPPCEGVVEGRDRWLNTAPAGQLPPNRFGLHDMHGNVYEWVEDCYFDDALTPGEHDAAPHRVDACERHAMRGGGWHNDPRRISSFYRAYNPPDWRDNKIGFRVARALD